MGKTTEIEIKAHREMTFNVIRLRESIERGQRVDAFEVDRWVDGDWKTFAKGTSIGACRLIRTEGDIAATRVRLRITQSAAPAVIAEFGLYLEGRQE